jgi:predicted lipoprotein with Yx(FWY)xxD motif/uncharacterized cupredoxin-like copper-binding protein
MRSYLFVVRLMAVMGMLLAFGGSALAEGTPAAEGSQPTVFVRQDPTAGTILTDPAGRTLYLFTKDTTENQSVCEGDCLTNWPAFTADEPLSLPGKVDGELSTFDRSDGSKQVSYNGIPLYYFAGDSGPGDVNGQGKGGVWFVVAPGQQFGAPVATPAAAASSPEASGDEYTVDVTLQEFMVMASTTDFEVGQKYTFNVTNSGKYAHQFVIEKAGANYEPLEDGGNEAEIEKIEAGSSQTIEWTFAEAGNYQLACHLMTHYPMGMALTIHVK